MWTGYIGDEILTSYIGIIMIIINHYKDPYFKKLVTSIMESKRRFFRGSSWSYPIDGGECWFLSRWKVANGDRTSFINFCLLFL